MNAPVLQVGTLIELQASRDGFLAERDVYQTCFGLAATSGPAVVLIRGQVSSGNASAGAARHLGAALADADDITVLGSGPGQLDFAALVQAAAVEECSFRARPA
ncbi:hypothetical protein ACGFNU_24505 [Spirillospora sp. NPDC048911]|uniref:hypothetical protein n=1 Tax=Spirillospora sp. NPDC048911 TaxID=3364527 RepID=UPI0037105383